MSNIKLTALDSWRRLYPWLKQNGLAGYDPYSIRELPFYQWLSSWPQFLPLKLIRFPIIRFIEFYPSLWIKLLAIKPKFISKGIGLLASSYLALHRETLETFFLKDADYCLEWLLKNSTQGYSGFCWDVPFVWQFPSKTPCSVVSIIVAHAFWERYQTLGQTDDLDVCISVCEFLTNDLQCDEISNNEVCFSYTPIDSTHILNSSLFTSEFLLRIGHAIQNEKWIELGKRGINYVVKNQQRDGSFWYYGMEDWGKLPISTANFKKIDGYHTGFILRMLQKANNILDEKKIDLAIDTGLNYYIKNFISTDTGIPYTHINIHRNKINIHGCAEALLTLNLFYQNDAEKEKILTKVLSWIIDNMQDHSGYFYYEKTPLITKKIAYLRWGQAWMARALSDIIESRN